MSTEEVEKTLTFNVMFMDGTPKTYSGVGSFTDNNGKLVMKGVGGNTIVIDKERVRDYLVTPVTTVPEVVKPAAKKRPAPRKKRVK